MFLFLSETEKAFDFSKACIMIKKHVYITYFRLYTYPCGIYNTLLFLAAIQYIVKYTQNIAVLLVLHLLFFAYHYF